MRNFTAEDFNGAGQYLIRNDKAPNTYIDTGFMSSIMYKVGYIYIKDSLSFEQRSCLISMSDGLVKDGYYKDKVFIPFIYNTRDGVKDDLINYLNDTELCPQEFRFATQEEVIRVVTYQSSRWRN